MQFSKSLLLLVLVLCFSKVLSAQVFFDIAVPCPVVQPEHVQHFTAGAVLNPNLIILPPLGSGSASWSLPAAPTVGADCSTVFGGPLPNSHDELLGGNLNARFITSGSPQIVISSASGAPLTAGEYTLAVRLSTGGNTYVKNFRFIVRRPIDLVFALDRSGSMECDTDEDSAADWPGCATSDTDGNASADSRRWNILATAIDHFMLKLDPAHTLAADRLSVVYFDGNTGTASVLLGGMSFRDVDTFRGMTGSPTAFKLELDNMNGSGNDLGRNGTSIGAALVEAINGRFGGAEDPARREVVLLFTDGEQNTGNWVRSTGPDAGRVIQQSRTNTTPVLNLEAAAVDDIEVLAVSTVTTGTGPGLLQSIAKDPGQFFTVLPGQEDRFGSDMAGHAFNEIFNQYSPQYIDSKRLPLGGNPQADFVVNRNVNRLIFQAFYSGPVRGTVGAKIYRNGIDVTRLGQLSRTNLGLNIIFPLYLLAELPSEGTWRVELSPPSGSGVTPGTEVSLFATADDHNIRFTAGTVENNLIVGQPFSPTLELSEAGQPVDNATVTATILRPGDDLGDLLARTELRRRPTPHTESGSFADLKLGALRRENPSALVDLYRVQRNRITLNAKGNGRYEGVFRNVDLTGVYRIRYDIKYASSRLGEVQRMVEHTRYVTFPPVDLQLTAKAAKGEALQAGTIVTVTPAYRVSGQLRLIGPGYPAAFGTNNPAVTVQAFDNWDGSYRMVVSGPPNEKFRLYLVDREVFRGDVEAFNAGGKGSASYLALSGGITRPRGDLDRLYDPGYYGQVALGKRFGLLGAELAGGYYGFDPDYHIIGGTAYLNVHLGPQGAGWLTLGAGPGYYVPMGEDGRFGGSAHARLQRRFGGLDLGVEGGYFRLTEPEVDFLTLGLRLEIGF